MFDNDQLTFDWTVRLLDIIQLLGMKRKSLQIASDPTDKRWHNIVYNAMINGEAGLSMLEETMRVLRTAHSALQG